MRGAAGRVGTSQVKSRRGIRGIFPRIFATRFESKVSMTEVEEPSQTPTQLRNSVGHLRSYIICLFLTNSSRKLESSLFSSDDGFFGLLGAPF